jgi:hypothetical protein
MIKIDFEKTDGTYTFRDAIWLPDNHTMTDDEIESLKEERFQNWLSIINTPPQDITEPFLPEEPPIDG